MQQAACSDFAPCEDQIFLLLVLLDSINNHQGIIHEKNIAIDINARCVLSCPC